MRLSLKIIVGGVFCIILITYKGGIYPPFVNIIDYICLKFLRTFLYFLYTLVSHISDKVIISLDVVEATGVEDHPCKNLKSGWDLVELYFKFDLSVYISAQDFRSLLVWNPNL